MSTDQQAILDAELARLRKRAERERRAREEAEATAEAGTRLLYQNSQQMRLLYLIADAASRADSVDEVIQMALDQLCQYMGWPIGHAYRVTDDPVLPLEPTNLWCMEASEQFIPFRLATDRTFFRRDQGLPGRVLETGAPVWVADLAAEANFPRLAQAVEIGLHGAFAIPVLVGGNVMAVLEFFSRELANPDEEWMQFAMQVGAQVGRCFEREARQEADRANRAKSEFLSRMSHELRTPLNAILGFGQLLAMDPLPPSQESCVQHILKGGRHLLNLIDEVLDVSRIEAGQIHLSPEPINIFAVMQEVMGMMGPLAANQNVTIHPAPVPRKYAYVQADRQRLKQVLLNLLSNSVKYNRVGGHVYVDWHEIDQRWRISVRDTGAGIAAHKLQQLFTPFERLGAELSGVEGTGLGLALSKRLAELMGGHIGVESVHGEGSTFWLELGGTLDPGLAAPPLPELGTLAPNSEQPRTILYIEDNESNLQLMERVLSALPNVRLLSAGRAGAGLHLAQQCQPEVILLDLNLPDMNGYEALIRLQHHPATSAIPVVILSADATPGQIRRLLAAGAAAYLTKPFDISALFRTLQELLGEKDGGANLDLLR